MLVYDITDADSFERVKNWVKELRQMLGNSVALVIVGNKIDLEKNRVVPAATAEYTGRWGVLDLQQTFGLSLDKALEVSDHNPVWAAFRPWEAPRVPLTAQAPAADTPAR